MFLKGRKMMYLIIPVVVGMAISVQGIFSNKIGEQIGLIQMVIMIHIFGLILALLVFFIGGNKSFEFVKQVNLMTIIAGGVGVLIVSGFARSISLNGVLMTVMISVMVQMVISKVVDHFGLFGVTKVPVNLMQIIAIVVMFAGVVLYQKNQ